MTPVIAQPALGHHPDSVALAFRLVLCEHCTRHIRPTEQSCPFCGSTQPQPSNGLALIVGVGLAMLASSGGCGAVYGAPGGLGGTPDASGSGGSGAGSGGTGALGGTGGTGLAGTGGTDVPGPKRLGRACMTDVECGLGLTCIQADSSDFDGEGPAMGYCTSECSADPTVCAQFDSAASCLTFDNQKAFCFEGCSFGPDYLTQFDTNKCHGRYESACRPLYDAQGNFSVAVCFPQCNGDADCGGSSVCNPKTGLCGAGPFTGKGTGEPCVQSDAGNDECKGLCVGLAHDMAGDSKPFTHVCTETCSMGAPASCGWGGIGTGPAEAACLFTSATISDNLGPGFGDLGYCAELCNCNADCKNSDLICRAWPVPRAPQLQQYYGKDGYCSEPQTEDGGTDPGITSCGGTGGTAADAATD